MAMIHLYIHQMINNNFSIIYQMRQLEMKLQIFLLLEKIKD